MSTFGSEPPAYTFSSDRKQVPGVNTSSSPSATLLYGWPGPFLLAWTNNDANATISWVNFSTTDLFPKLPPDEPSQEYDETVIVGQEYFDFSNKIVDTGFSTQAGSGPALTNFNSTPWMAFLENPAQAPWIPSFPENQRRQPPVIMVSSLNGSTWSTPQPLWDPGLSGLDLFVNGYQGPAAITAPALAASASEIMAVWVENAVDGSDALAVFAEGTLASPPASPTIFFAKYANGAWTQRKPVKGALTRATPALCGSVRTGTFYMAWQGHSDNSIWFAQYSDQKGWSETEKLPIFETSAGPALAQDDVDDTELVWKGKSDNNMFWASYQAGAVWSPRDPGNGWSSQIKLPIIATGIQPSLCAYFPLLVFKGVRHDDVWVVAAPVLFEGT